MKEKSIAIYGGSFSPPHMGHVLAARAYLEKSGADRLLIMPAKKPPHKRLDGMVSDTDRVNMCRLAFCEDEVLGGRCEVSEWELSRDKTSYTVDTVEHFMSEGYTDIYLLIGTDMLLSFESWYRYRDLFKYVTLCYIDRYDSEKETCDECARRFAEQYGARIIFVDAPVFEASSTRIRELLATGESADGFINDKVYQYITKNSLYK